MRGLPLFVLLAFFAAVAEAGSWGPWSVSPEAPAIITRSDREPLYRPKPEPRVSSVAATPFLWLITFYQRAISPLDGDRCSMHPTCSQYSVQAIRRHGPVIGIVMTVDRLIHEGDEQRHAVMARVGDRFRFDDPVSNNDFWWHGE